MVFYKYPLWLLNTSYYSCAGPQKPQMAPSTHGEGVSGDQAALPRAMGPLAWGSAWFGAAPAGLWVRVTNCAMTIWSMHDFRDVGSSPSISGHFSFSFILVSLDCRLCWCLSLEQFRGCPASRSHPSSFPKHHVGVLPLLIPRGSLLAAITGSKDCSRCDLAALTPSKKQNAPWS